MIGGIDVEIPTKRGLSSLEIAVRTIRGRLPLAEFENGITGDRYHEFQQIPFGEIEEIFVYTDRDSAERWDDDGATSVNFNTMIHLVADEETLTLVVDERNASMDEIIGAVASALGGDTPTVTL